MLRTPRERLLDLLRLTAMEIAEYEARAADARTQRDTLLLRGLTLRVPERLLAAHSGVSRGWIHKLKVHDRNLSPRDE